MTTLNNPILNAELHHQWYVMEKSRSGRMWILLAVILLLPAGLTSLVLFVRVLLGQPIPGVPWTVGQPFDLLAAGQVMLLVMNIALTVVVMLVSFALSTNSITREKRGKTWDNLILTNVSARKLVLGKWIASLKALDGDHIMIGVLRLGMVAWIVAGFQDRMLANTLPIQTHLILLTILVVLFTIIDAMFNTALGIGLVMGDLPDGLSTALFFLLRGLGIIYIGWVFVQVIGRLFAQPDAAYFIPGLIGLAGYLLLTGAILWGAGWLAVRNSLVSPSPKE
jgi:hypothetical protein